MFARLDTNKDGKLTKAEVEAVRAARTGASAKGRGMRDRLFARADTNKDGVITLAEFQATPKPQVRQGREAGSWRQARADMLARPTSTRTAGSRWPKRSRPRSRHFDSADTNSDGKVTPEERKAAFKAMRAQHKS